MEISIFGVIKQVGIFIICAQMILHFKAADKYGKYIRLLISFMVLVQLVVPIFGMVWNYDTEQFWESVEYYEDSIEQSIDEIKITDVFNEQEINSAILQEVKTRINNSKTATNAVQESGTQELDAQGLEEQEAEVYEDETQAKEPIEINVVEIEIEIGEETGGGQP